MKTSLPQFHNFYSRCAGYYRKHQEVLSYFIFGIFTTLVNWLVFFCLFCFVGVNYVVSNVIAWKVAIIFAYVTNKIFVFKSKKNDFLSVLYEFSLFVGCRVFSGGVDILILVLFVELLLMPEWLAKLITNVFIIIINYIFSKILVFKKV